LSIEPDPGPDSSSTKAGVDIPEKTLTRSKKHKNGRSHLPSPKDTKTNFVTYYRPFIGFKGNPASIFG
jgi:hypothetical protein